LLIYGVGIWSGDVTLRTSKCNQKGVQRRRSHAVVEWIMAAAVATQRGKNNRTIGLQPTVELLWVLAAET
jgi:hypothetical protein